ncbi:MAG: hypothetical protein IJQ93_05180 [Bacteroidales bacterium]|nr:hypothetical protein [Bacteroidales bacterium]
MTLEEFILEHENDDTAQLVLHRDRWPEIDVALASECISARRKLRSKVPEWYADPGIMCPIALSAEQCSSTATARFKAEVAVSALCRPSSKNGCSADEASAPVMPSLKNGCSADVANAPVMPSPKNGCSADGSVKNEGTCGMGFRIADLTGGLGVDCWQFSKNAARVLYNEMNPLLFEAAKRNLPRLGCSNVEFSNLCIDSDNLPLLLESFRPDIVFADPARRSAQGRKVFRPEDCSPDVLKLQDIVLEHGAKFLLKLSPMADISLMANVFHNVREIYVVESEGECKELLLLMVPGFDGEPEIVVGDFRFRRSLEKGAAPKYINESPSPGEYLFQPGPALSKSGAFNLLCERFTLEKLGPSAHLYICRCAAHASNPNLQVAGELAFNSRLKDNGTLVVCPPNQQEDGALMCSSSLQDNSTLVCDPCVHGNKVLHFNVALKDNNTLACDPGLKDNRVLPYNSGQNQNDDAHTRSNPDKEKMASVLESLGKWFKILEVAPFGNSAMKDFAARWPDADVSARGLPLSSDALREKLSSGAKKKKRIAKEASAAVWKSAGSHNVHIFGIGSSVGKLLIACRPC